jgi:hypothetical protein
VGESRRRRQAAEKLGQTIAPVEPKHLRLFEIYLDQPQLDRMHKLMETTKHTTEDEFIGTAIMFVMDSLEKQEEMVRAHEERSKRQIMTPAEWEEEQAARRDAMAREEARRDGLEQLARSTGQGRVRGV